MMLAKSQDAPFAAAKAESGPAQAAGFGRVFNSIQGLQQRLEDFSIDDLSRAEAKAATLIRELSSIQLKLTILPLIKRAFYEVQRTVDSLRDETSEVATLSGLEKYSTLSNLLTTANRLQQAVRATPERPHASEPGLNQKPRPTQPVPFTETAPIEVSDWVLGDVEPYDPNSAHKADAAGDIQAAVAQERAQSSEKFHFGSQTAGRRPAESFEIKSARPLGSGTSRDSEPFDQRLLEDLIKSYGDFMSFSETRCAPEGPPELTPPDTQEAQPPGELSGATPSHVENRVPIGTTPGSLETEKMAEAMISGQIEKRRSGSGTGTSLTKIDDIDRQLKRIVQDYGEYDLYSQRSPLSTKVAGILAFVLLALVMAAFYLFRTPSGVASHSLHSTQQPETQPFSAKPTIAVKEEPANTATNQKNEKQTMGASYEK